MDRFVSTFTNRLDAKGRVSVPASFRGILTRDGFDGVYVYPALGVPALDAGGNRLVEEINGLVEQLPPYSDERDHLSAALYGDSEVLRADGEGRILLSERLKAHAGIVDHATFVGLGHKFQIWEPDRFRTRQEEARARVRELKQLLGGVPSATAGQSSGVGE